MILSYLILKSGNDLRLYYDHELKSRLSKNGRFSF